MMVNTTGISAAIRRFLNEESGSTAIEYGLVGALVGVGCVLAFTVFGDGLQNLFGAGSTGAGPALESAASAAAS